MVVQPISVRIVAISFHLVNGLRASNAAYMVRLNLIERGVAKRRFIISVSATARYASSLVINLYQIGPRKGVVSGDKEAMEDYPDNDTDKDDPLRAIQL